MGRTRSNSREDRSRTSRDHSKGGRDGRKRRHRSSSSSLTSSSSDSGSSSRRRNQGSRRRRSRSRSYERSRRRSRSRSYERSRTRRSRSRSRSRSREKHRSDKSRKEKNNEPTIRLDSKAVDVKKETPLSVEEQISRIQAVEEIQSEGFVPQSFMSTRANKPSVAVKTELGGTVEFANQSTSMSVLDKGGLCHPKLFLNQAEKEDRWLRKLFEMRQKILREDPTFDDI